MHFEWTPHRFSGGALALDLANSVILRHDASRSIDRLASPGAVEGFCAAASHLSADQALPAGLAPPDPAASHHLVILRESIDRYYRAMVTGHDDNILLAELLEACATALRLGGQPGDATPLLTATATSALALLSADNKRRMKICAHCGWLFIDRSRNSSRTWCDMAVCGNRVKASRHYRRMKGTPT